MVDDPEPEPIQTGGVTLLEAIEELDSKQPLVILKRRYLKRKAKTNDVGQEENQGTEEGTGKKA